MSCTGRSRTYGPRDYHGKLTASWRTRLFNQLRRLLPMQTHAYAGSRETSQIWGRRARRPREWSKIRPERRQSSAEFDSCSEDNPHRTLLEVNDVIREMIHLLRNETVQNAISIQTELEPDLPPIMADRVQLQQVLTNLMVNGIDAMKEVEGTRELIIQSRRADEAQLQISVRDTGVGLPSQQGDHIFDAFFTTKPHEPAWGCALAALLLNHTAVACGLTIILRRVLSFISRFLSITRLPNDGAGCSHCDRHR